MVAAVLLVNMAALEQLVSAVVATVVAAEILIQTDVDKTRAVLLGIKTSTQVSNSSSALT